MDLRERLAERFKQAKERLFYSSIPQRLLGDFLGSLKHPMKDQNQVLRKKEIEAIIQNLPSEASYLFTQSYNYYSHDPLRPFNDGHGNTWLIYSNNARNMAFSVKNRIGTPMVTSSYVHADAEEIRKDHAVLVAPDGNEILAEFTSIGNLITISRPRKKT